MDFKAIWSDAAIADLRDICSYIARHDPQAAKNRKTCGEWHEWCRRYYQRREAVPFPAEPAQLAPPGVDQEAFRRNAEWLDRSQWPRCRRIIEQLASTGALARNAGGFAMASEAASLLRDGGIEPA
jgi:hypothetical protein